MEPQWNSTPRLVSPGYYPDPSAPKMRLRWWDGSEWTDTTQAFLRRWDWKRISLALRSRVRPSEFWAAHGIGLGTVLLVGALFTDVVSVSASTYATLWWVAFAWYVFVAFGATVNRLHDLNLSGWLVLLFVIAWSVPVLREWYLYWLLLIWFGSRVGDRGLNRWGLPIA